MSDPLPQAEPSGEIHYCLGIKWGDFRPEWRCGCGASGAGGQSQWAEHAADALRKGLPA